MTKLACRCVSLAGLSLIVFGLASSDQSFSVRLLVGLGVCATLIGSGVRSHLRWLEQLQNLRAQQRAEWERHMILDELGKHTQQGEPVRSTEDVS